MATLAKRTSSPMAEMLDWLESNSPLNLHGVGLAPYVRVEDYLDEGAYVPELWVAVWTREALVRWAAGFEAASACQPERKALEAEHGRD